MKRVWPILLGLMAVGAYGRTWTSTAGTSLEADYVGVRNSTVTLRKADGRLFEVGLQYLSEADKAYVNEQKSADPAVATVASAPAQATPAASPVSAKPASNGTASAFGSSGPVRKDLLTDDQIAALKTELPGKKEGEKILFSANFTQRQLTSAEKKKLKDGEVPFRITVDVLEVSVERGKQVAKRMSGYVRYYVLDGENKPLVSRRDSLEKMCPT